MRWGSWGVLLLGGVLLLPSLSVAQSSDEDGRRHFEQGVAALDAGRFAEARDRFRASMELTPRVSTAFNLGVALRGTGETIEALAVFDSLLGGEYGALSEPVRAQVSTLRQEVSRQVAVVTIHVDADDSVRLFVDGRLHGSVRDEDEVRLNAGAHVLRGEDGSRATDPTTLELERGSATHLRLDFVQAEPGTGENADVGEAERSTSLEEDPWFWAVLVGAILAAGAAVAVTVVAVDSASSDVFGETEVLRVRF